jgi:hypothetical protein
MDVRKKVLLDVFASPATLLPVVGGVTALLGSWAFSLGAWPGFLGVVGILAGLGVSATKLIFGLEKITNDAYEFVLAQKVKQQEDQLDQLDLKLVTDRDPRTQTSLRQLRQLNQDFADDVEQGKVARSAHDVLKVIEELVTKCVAQLERSYQLWHTARGMSGQTKEELLAEREQVIAEVVEAVRHVEKTTGQFRTFTAKKNEDDLGRLRQELDEAIQVARRAEDRVAQWDRTGYAEAEVE